MPWGEGSEGVVVMVIIAVSAGSQSVRIVKYGFALKQRESLGT